MSSGTTSGFIDVLNNISWPTAIVIILFMFRSSLSNLITRLTSFKYKNGDNEVGLNAEPIASNVDDSMPDPEEKPEKSVLKIDSNKTESNYLNDMMTSIMSGNKEAAESAFSSYLKQENDPKELKKNKALFLYFKYVDLNDFSALGELESLVKTIDDDDLLVQVYNWLDLCYSHTSEFDKSSKLWRDLSLSTTSVNVKITAISNLALSLVKEGELEEARSKLVEALKIDSVEQVKNIYLIYSALSKVESKMNNNVMSVYCLDKAVEYNNRDTGMLFDSAYAASNNSLEEVAVSNYNLLIKIDSDNSYAFNNLAVQAKEAGFNFKAIENYQKAADHKNTLAMANLGYALLNAGFSQEAKDIAEKALEFNDVHANVHRLLSDVKTRVEDKNKEWDEFTENLFKRQKFVREYTEKYYSGDSSLLEGSWVVLEKYEIKFQVENDKVKSSWVEDGSSDSTYLNSIDCIVHGATLVGTVKRILSDGLGVPNIYSSPKVEDVFGYYCQNSNTIKLVSKQSKNNFELTLVALDK
ncbi:hypothetical protein PY479_05140 [Shewanella sp. A32]|uniref:tetratricopeptide repeat protein n=1 Tax=Shewanella sp. A32 TaxID=3031327 RepID=UPI0023BA1C45|nr:hypothetical protein [Shewanella sp. A32]MDF0533664.1 hypothetical protein [Shewanella sp. A32]